MQTEYQHNYSELITQLEWYNSYVDRTAASIDNPNLDIGAKSVEFCTITSQCEQKFKEFFLLDSLDPSILKIQDLFDHYLETSSIVKGNFETLMAKNLFTIISSMDLTVKSIMEEVSQEIMCILEKKHVYPSQIIKNLKHINSFFSKLKKNFISMHVKLNLAHSAVLDGRCDWVSCNAYSLETDFQKILANFDQVQNAISHCRSLNSNDCKNIFALPYKKAGRNLTLETNLLLEFCKTYAHTPQKVFLAFHTLKTNAKILVDKDLNQSLSKLSEDFPELDQHPFKIDFNNSFIQGTVEFNSGQELIDLAKNYSICYESLARLIPKINVLTIVIRNIKNSLNL